MARFILLYEILKPVFAAAIEKVKGEQLVKKALLEGMSCVAAFDQFGIM